MLKWFLPAAGKRSRQACLLYGRRVLFVSGLREPFEQRIVNDRLIAIESGILVGASAVNKI
ncbi:MAG: hypothetical protein WBD33_22750 [Xanthobacteraceae bacterium]